MYSLTVSDGSDGFGLVVILFAHIDAEDIAYNSVPSQLPRSNSRLIAYKSLTPDRR
jgi:hypothetical protein